MLPMLTAEEFLEQRYELPEAGQWSELVQGVAVCLQPPDLDHGTVVLNLSKALADFVERSERGYACFDLGLRVQRDPDTVLFPAICYFLEGDRFSEADREITDTIPALVVELASTSDRRRQMPERIEQYLKWGVCDVWVINSRAHTVQIARHREGIEDFPESAILRGEPLLEGFEMPVGQLFAEPTWWR